MQHKTTQRTTEHTPEHKPQHRPDTEHSTEQTQYPDTEQHTEHRNKQSCTEQRTTSAQNSTDYLHTYSFDLYNEYIAIKNSNTIELYTISKD